MKQRPKTEAQYRYLKDQRDIRRIKQHIEEFDNYREDPLDWLKPEWRPKKVTYNGNLLHDESHYDRHELNAYMEGL